MKAETLPPADHAEWDRFVESTPGGHLFLTAGWHQAWSIVPEVRVARDGSGNICAGIAFTPGRFLGGAALRRPTFTPYNHPLLDEARLPRVSQQVEAMRALVGDLTTYSTLDFVFRHGASLATPFFVHAGFHNQLSLTYVIEASAQGRWREALSKSHRYDLRRAEEQAAREEWQVRPSTDARESWELFRATGARKDFPLDVPADLFATAVRRLHERQAGELWTLREASGRVLATSWLVRDRAFAYYLANGAADLPRPFLGNYLLLRSMIEDTLERGLGFDFEGSVLPGVEQFFRGFGGKLRTNVRQIRMSSAARSLAWSIGSWARSRRRGG